MKKLSVKKLDFGSELKDFMGLVKNFMRSFEVIQEMSPEKSVKYKKILKQFFDEVLKDLT